MLVTRVKLTNWRNFQNVDVSLRERTFVVGPNAAGKSNFLDVFRFLRDVASGKGGGLQQAVAARGGVSKLRPLAARKNPKIEIEVQLANGYAEIPVWRYAKGRCGYSAPRS
jgi:predicted ATPase